MSSPDFAAAISGDRPLQLITDASADVLGAVKEQDQGDGKTRPTSFLSKSTFPNEKERSATEFECVQQQYGQWRKIAKYITAYHLSL